jgi:hypothetical protein
MGSIAGSRATEGGAGREVRDAEVSSLAQRRRLTAADTRRVLAEADAGPEPGQVGARWRREGWSSAQLTTWRRPREHGVLEALTPKQRGRKAQGLDPLAQRVAPLERDHARLRQQRQQAEPSLEGHQKVAALVGMSPAGNPPGGRLSWPPRGDERRALAPGRLVMRGAFRAPAPRVISHAPRARVSRSNGRPRRSHGRARTSGWWWRAGPLRGWWLRPRGRCLPPAWRQGATTAPAGPCPAGWRGRARSASAEGSAGGRMTTRRSGWPLALTRGGRGRSPS